MGPPFLLSAEPLLHWPPPQRYNVAPMLPYDDYILCKKKSRIFLSPPSSLSLLETVSFSWTAMIT